MRKTSCRKQYADATYEIILKHHEITQGDMKEIEAKQVRRFR